MKSVIVATALLAVSASTVDARGHRHHRYHHVRHAGSPGIPGSIQGALHRVASSCAGFRVVSHFRPGARVAGTRRTSLHASGRAVDFRVNNWSCAYRVLAGWPHGLSTDAPHVRHIHISAGGHERRFAHHHVGSRYSFAKKRKHYRSMYRRHKHRV